ncbi:MAG: DUF4902 domain-containing protein [Hyphomicrobiales bacterium]|nr:MAG: DUF4902 domain-containing protein [Hyphomicrobiales bacterium]
MNLAFDEGLLRIRQQELKSLDLLHLISGIDDSGIDGGKHRCGSSTVLTGYTEWISAKEPRLTLGWDWQLDTTSAAAGVVRLGLPRTNVLVVREAHVPLSWDQSLEALALRIDELDWGGPAFRAVCERYASWPEQEAAHAHRWPLTAVFGVSHWLRNQGQRPQSRASVD